MKAIYIPGNFINQELMKLNNELKDVHTIIKEISTHEGTILIVDNVTRKEKLEELNKIAEK